ncbi:MAG TPA: substrate-binding domain-containing protein [Ruminiclostridium sp.]
MKKILCVILSTLFIVSMVACGSAPAATTTSTASTTTVVPAASTDTATPAADKPLIGISVPQAPTGWVAAVQYYANKQAKELGLNFKILAAADPNEQASQIDDLINMKPVAIILMPCNDQVAVAAQKIKDAGIKLIDFDRTINPTVPDFYLAGDNYGIGVEGAKYIAEKLGKKGSVIVCGIAAYGDAVNGERIKGFTDTIATLAPDIKILGSYDSANGAPESGLKTMTDALQANKVIDGVFSIDDELSVGLYQAITEQKRTDIKVLTGGGGAQSYFKLMDQAPADVWLASALYTPSMIVDCVKMADAIIKGTSPAAKTIVPSKIVDRANVKDYIDAGSPY